MSNTMIRRSVFKSVLAGLAGLGTAFSVAKAQAATAKQKVAYHLSDADKVGFVLGNIQNHLDGVGGPANVEIALVVHGPALKAFHELAANDKIKASVAKLHKDGLAMNACGNTMKAQAVELKDLLPGFVRADQGGVVRLAELQGQGYVYLRP
jgi:uncharacterized protein